MGIKASRKSSDGLTVKERIFCNCFVVHQKVRKSLLEAGYNFKNGHTADVYASKILKKPAIKLYLGQLSKKIQGEQEQVCEQAKKVIKELDTIGFVDPRKFVDVDDKGVIKVKPLNKLGNEAKAISKIKQTVSGSGDNKTVTTEFSFHSKTESLRMLGEHHKLYTQMVRHSGEVISPIIYRLPDDGSREPPSV